MKRSPSARLTSNRTDRTHTSASSCWPCTRTSRKRSWTCCGRMTMSRIPSITFALLLTLALPLRAEDDESRFEVKYGKNFTFSGGRVSIDHGFGELTIRTHNSSQVQVRATIRSSDEEIGKRSEEHTSELQSRLHLVCRLLLEKKKKN